MKCSVCGKETKNLYDGKCAQCLSIDAMGAEKRELDAIHDLGDLQINEPIGDDLYMLFSLDQRK